jgi:hypothetical protein
MVWHAVDCLHAKISKLSLLPNRSVAVVSFTLEEAVMHHADPKRQDGDEKKRNEDDRQDLIQR